MQWLGSFVVFFYPGAKDHVRASIAPYHIGLGLAILALVAATVESGLLEKLSFNNSCNVTGRLYGNHVKGHMAFDCVTGNVIGVLVALSLVSVVVTIWLAKHSDTSNERLKDETTPLLLDS